MPRQSTVTIRDHIHAVCLWQPPAESGPPTVQALTAGLPFKTSPPQHMHTYKKRRDTGLNLFLLLESQWISSRWESAESCTCDCSKFRGIGKDIIFPPVLSTLHEMNLQGVNPPTSHTPPFWLCCPLVRHLTESEELLHPRAFCSHRAFNALITGLIPTGYLALLRRTVENSPINEERKFPRLSRLKKIKKQLLSGVYMSNS